MRFRPGPAVEVCRHVPPHHAPSRGARLDAVFGCSLTLVIAACGSPSELSSPGDSTVVVEATVVETVPAATDYAVSPIAYDLLPKVVRVGETVTLNATCPPSDTHAVASVEVHIHDKLTSQPLVPQTFFEVPIIGGRFTFSYTIPPIAEPSHPEFGQFNTNNLYVLGLCGTGEPEPSPTVELTEDDFLALIDATPEPSTTVPATSVPTSTTAPSGVVLPELS